MDSKFGYKQAMNFDIEFPFDVPHEYLIYNPYFCKTLINN